MAQEVTVIMLVDVPAALEANTLEGNLYLVDNLLTEGSENEGTGKLISAVNGTHWFDGSQASEQLINWLPYSITSLSPQLPRFYADDRLDDFKDRAINSLLNRPGTKNFAAVADMEGGVAIDPFPEPQDVPVLTSVADTHGRRIVDDVPLMDLRGNFISFDDAVPMVKAVAPGEDAQVPGGPSPDISYISYLTPQITNITGEAVDKGVIYPAQYGTPAPIKGGWYWCASVNTYMTGVYSYTLHITLYQPERHGNEVIWKPVYFTQDASIKVTSGTMRNGFTNGGLGLLPVL
ncbi:hypothetical protein HNQ91_001690 [Filimonas zeae]|uniref:Uncharacterized protein n=1 Tax=Filimonas zeae TaxID=1737353 RepID=A0A917IYP9_9BACT|nr:hypothetical protein [Filimonas zeae]MDR6338639.1 hypothetical protein [Filimonas zeae]GGH67272.1 hypothetical protein GCM10011379_22370 [Filimonas zeae]